MVAVGGGGGCGGVDQPWALQLHASNTHTHTTYTPTHTHILHTHTHKYLQDKSLDCAVCKDEFALEDVLKELPCGKSWEKYY